MNSIWYGIRWCYYKLKRVLIWLTLFFLKVSLILVGIWIIWEGAWFVKPIGVLTALGGIAWFRDPDNLSKVVKWSLSQTMKVVPFFVGIVYLWNGVWLMKLVGVLCIGVGIMWLRGADRVMHRVSWLLSYLPLREPPHEWENDH